MDKTNLNNVIKDSNYIFKEKRNNLQRIHEDLQYYSANSNVFYLLVSEDDVFKNKFLRFSVLFSYALKGYDIKKIDEILYKKINNNKCEDALILKELTKLKPKKDNIDSFVFLKNYLKKEFLPMFWEFFKNEQVLSKSKKIITLKDIEKKSSKITFDSFVLTLDSLLTELESIKELNEKEL